MKLTNKLVEEVIAMTAGEDTIDIVEYLKGKKNISEFTIAEVVKRPINETRNALYRLFRQNLVTFNRKKDKKKGWYIYYWTYNPDRVQYLAQDLKQTRLIKLHERLERENSNNFYACASMCARLDFEQAMEFEFKCPECGQLMNQMDNTRTIDNLKQQIKELEKEMKAKASKKIKPGPEDPEPTSSTKKKATKRKSG